MQKRRRARPVFQNLRSIFTFSGPKLSYNYCILAHLAIQPIYCEKSVPTHSPKVCKKILWKYLCQPAGRMFFPGLCSENDKMESQIRNIPQICKDSVRDFLRTISIGCEFEYGDQWDESAVTLHAHCSQDLIGLCILRELWEDSEGPWPWGRLRTKSPMCRPCCLATWQSCQICHSSVRKFLIDYTTLIEIYIIFVEQSEQE